MRLNIFEKAFGSALFTGYIPIASGTFGSLAGLAFYLIPGFESHNFLIPAIIVIGVSGVFVADKFEKVYGHDPAQCTIDEVIGMWITLISVPKAATNLLIAFFVWRIYDIVKPYPASFFDKMNGGIGIIMDDVAAAFYALLTTHVIIFLLNRLF